MYTPPTASSESVSPLIRLTTEGTVSYYMNMPSITNAYANLTTLRYKYSSPSYIQAPEFAPSYIFKSQ